MTPKAGGKPYRGRRERGRTQLHEAGAPALAAGRPQSPADLAPLEGGEGETPHYHGHRERLRSRLKEAGDGALADYELLELVLFSRDPAPRREAAREEPAREIRLLRRDDRRGPRTIG
jgi:hypothetical protein